MGVLNLLKNLKITTSSFKRPRVISKSNTNESSSTSQWICETVKVFYPHGHSKPYEEYVSLYIKLLMDQRGKGIHSLGTGPKSPKTFNTGNCFWGSKQYMKSSELETSSYLKDDCLSIHCTIEVVQDHAETAQTNFENGKDYVIPVPTSDMIQNLKGLLESGIGSDVTFQVGNELFRAHKAMFFRLVGNPNTETVAIEEFDPFTFKAMLLFLYSDELPKTHELSDSDSRCTSTTIMQHLLAAADRFDLSRLRVMCEAKLCLEISANTVATTLALAEQHQCLQLKTACLNFVAKPENFGQFVKSDGFASLEKSFPSLLIDLLKTGAVVDKTVA
ncbi:hypothetical protein MKX03_023949 [Papaver bracteatum]|nr:hypothetical protein MKX03_023949 [Papaver bracteatum]